jgi:threonine/homoserine/homoserine lactone efflux protein
MTVEFLITSLIVIVSPGTGVLYTLAAGLSRGSRASVVAAFGCTLGIVPHMAAAILGLAALLHTSALAFQTFKWLGVAYLLYMAWNALKERGALKVEQTVGARSDMKVTIEAILINILNPKLSIFFFAFLPAAIRHRQRAASARAHADAQCCVHGADLCGVRRIRIVRGSDP